MYVCMYVYIYVRIVCIFMMCTCMYITHPWTINEPHLPKKIGMHAFVHAHKIALPTSWSLQCSWWDLTFFREMWFINYCSWMYTCNCVSPRTKREELRYIGVQTTPTHSVSTCWLTGWVHTSLFPTSVVWNKTMWQQAAQSAIDWQQLQASGSCLENIYVNLLLSNPMLQPILSCYGLTLSIWFS